MRTPTVRAALALLLFSGWMALLFRGFALGGGVHLLLAAGLALFPWRAAGTPRPSLPSSPRVAGTGAPPGPPPRDLDGR